ncbi:MAG: phosphoribosyltransferase [Terriglobia bacterium]
MFLDRAQAGSELAKHLLVYRKLHPIVLAIPRGGVPVALEVARSLAAPVSLVIPRKIGAPGNPEMAIGAVGGRGRIILNRPLVAALGISDSYVAREADRQMAEVRRREHDYLGSAGRPNLTHKTVIVVDDGLASGFTALAAVSAVKADQPRQVVVAVPVGSAEAVARIRPEVDGVVCLRTPEGFQAVGEYYARFDQISDAEVIKMVQGHRPALGTA